MLWRTRFFIMVMKLLIIIPSCVLVIFVDMNMYILTQRRNFKNSGKQENYAIGLYSCYLFNLEHETEHDIVSAYGVCMH